MATIDDLSTLLSNLPNYSLISNQQKLDALAGALIPDSDSVWPGSTDPVYVPTYDIYFAALSLLAFLKAQPVVRQTSSEGTSVAVDAPNWASLEAYYRTMSPIVQATSSGVLGIIPIPMHHVHPTDMRSAVDGYDNVDTDLS